MQTSLEVHARPAPGVQIAESAPFGLVVRAQRAGAPLASLPVAALEAWVRDHRIVVLRGFAPLPGDALVDFGRHVGALLEWDVFGLVNTIEVRPGFADNTIWTERAVPLHWDHFGGITPRFLVFHCDVAPPSGAGGETLFVDTARVLASAPVAAREAWAKTEVNYGRFRAPLIARHPTTGAEVLRYIEPLHLDPAKRNADEGLFGDLRRRLYDPACCARHDWVEGDVLLADNFALLHGRAPLTSGAPRRIRRINVI